jgi:hypothetical protein
MPITTPVSREVPTSGGQQYPQRYADLVTAAARKRSGVLMRMLNHERLLARRPEGTFVNPFECGEKTPFQTGGLSHPRREILARIKTPILARPATVCLDRQV